jgi:hypothetical protein
VSCLCLNREAPGALNCFHKLRLRHARRFTYQSRGIGSIETVESDGGFGIGCGCCVASDLRARDDSWGRNSCGSYCPGSAKDCSTREHDVGVQLTFEDGREEIGAGSSKPGMKFGCKSEVLSRSRGS